MSKYVIIKKYHKPFKLGKDREVTYTLFFHTKTKLKDNEPYWSLNTSRNAQRVYAVTKKQLPRLLKLAQNQTRTNARGVIKKTSSDGKIFVLKLNSPKLLEIV